MAVATEQTKNGNYIGKVDFLDIRQKFIKGKVDGPRGKKIERVTNSQYDLYWAKEKVAEGLKSKEAAIAKGKELIASGNLKRKSKK